MSDRRVSQGTSAVLDVSFVAIAASAAATGKGNTRNMSPSSRHFVVVFALSRAIIVVITAAASYRCVAEAKRTTMAGESILVPTGHGHGHVWVGGGLTKRLRPLAAIECHSSPERVEKEEPVMGRCSRWACVGPLAGAVTTTMTTMTTMKTLSNRRSIGRQRQRRRRRRRIIMGDAAGTVTNAVAFAFSSSSSSLLSTSSLSSSPSSSLSLSLSSMTPIPPPPPISVPVWSLAAPLTETTLTGSRNRQNSTTTTNTSTTKSNDTTTMTKKKKASKTSSIATSMNIVTFATPVSVEPPKLYVVSLYVGTLTRRAFLDSGIGVLQLLTPDQRALVPILGMRSGYEEYVDIHNDWNENHDRGNGAGASEAADGDNGEMETKDEHTIQNAIANDKQCEMETFANVKDETTFSKSKACAALGMPWVPAMGTAAITTTTTTTKTKKKLLGKGGEHNDEDNLATNESQSKTKTEPLVSEYDGRAASSMYLLPRCATYIKLKLMHVLQAGDHDVALCQVVGTGFWNNDSGYVCKRNAGIDNNVQLVALDQNNVLYTGLLRDEGII